MKIIRITSTAILSLLLGAAASAYAQQEQKGEKQDHQQKSGHEQGGHEQAKPEQKHTQQQQRQQEQRRGQNDQQHAQQPRRGQNEQPHAQQQQRQSQSGQQRAQQQRQSQNGQQQRAAGQRRDTQEQQRAQRGAWQEHRARSWQSDHRTWQDRGGYNGYRIPEARFHGFFGPQHGFRIYGRPFLVVGGYPRFQYNGYWFSLVDPWPEYWANDWYQTDDVYLTYVDNGYYLFNRRHPNVGIAISISI